MDQEYTFSFGGVLSCIRIRSGLPSIDNITAFYKHSGAIAAVCDTHTEPIARQILGGKDAPLCALPPGEAAKTWHSAEAVLETAKNAGLGRDGLFIGVGGGVISDITAFAASVYMRGAGLCLISTSLLGMADAAVGGKTGFNLFGAKNFAGTFYPASLIYMPAASLASLPKQEWQSGMAEIIKTAVLDTSDETERFWSALAALPGKAEPPRDILVECIARSVRLKGRIVEADPRETGEERILLNLGHTFGHALEATAGLGQLSHGEAVAWGIVQACTLGRILGITPAERAERITALIRSFGYETRTPHPLAPDTAEFLRALQNDKKKKAGAVRFIVPAQTGAVAVSGEKIDPRLLTRILSGEEGYSCVS
ncbi:MAG: 3-dehydroquinate synthase [Spirochaetaceae bacterium]|jgi:3-dehydroquinate synthase|nr:3-dehydroquinate synthase [Spirochaetaceae bacterium]